MFSKLRIVLLFTLLSICFSFNNSVSAQVVDPCWYGCPKDGCPGCGGGGGPIGQKVEDRKKECKKVQATRIEDCNKYFTPDKNNAGHQACLAKDKILYDRCESQLLEIRSLYGEDGKPVKQVSLSNVISANVKGKDSPSHWAVSKDGAVYSIGVQRSATEFNAARKLFLKDAISLISQSKESLSKASDSCSTSTAPGNCVGKEWYACVHTICYRCWIEYKYEGLKPVPYTVCGSQTDDISCEPTGEACEK